jgi:aryl-alcohol dehydrogenase-like predicted oxidoreductase
VPFRRRSKLGRVQYRKLGATGLDVSRLGLGGRSFGEPARGNDPWTLGEEASRPLIRSAVEAGINFFDTANVYSAGSSEEIVGRALRDFARRDEVVIATKVWGRVHAGPNGAGLSRKAILAAIDASLRRLGTDYVDLYQIHRWDPGTPVEETLGALHDVVRAGKARYLGASSMFAWQFAQARHLAQRHGWTRFVAMQNHYNLLYREEEREMLPLCADAGVGVIPWSPLARGVLTRPWDARTARRGSDRYIDRLYGETERVIVTELARVAAARGVPPARVALAWVLAQPAVCAPIVGVTRPGHLQDALAACDLELTAAELAALEAPYRPRPAGMFG